MKLKQIRNTEEIQKVNFRKKRDAETNAGTNTDSVKPAKTEGKTNLETKGRAG